MKNNEWNIPSDYFEKNKKALMPVRKMSNRSWLLALAAACFVGIGLFMWKGEGIGSKHLSTDTGSNHLSTKEGEDIGSKHLSTNEGEDIGAKYLSTKEEDIGAKYLSTKEEDIGSKNLSPEKEDVGAKYLSPRIAEELKEIPREELVYYLLEEDSELIENLN